MQEAKAAGVENLAKNALLIGYEMAGGDAGNGHENIAVAVRAKLTQKFFGPPVTSTRKAFRGLLATLSDADSNYLSAAGNIGLGPTGATETAEGFVLMTHLFRIGCEAFLEHDVVRKRNEECDV